jgi:hypothetical protein
VHEHELLRDAARAPVVQERLPPVTDDVLRQVDGDDGAAVLLAVLRDELGERRRVLAVGRSMTTSGTGMWWNFQSSCTSRASSAVTAMCTANVLSCLPDEGVVDRLRDGFCSVPTSTIATSPVEPKCTSSSMAISCSTSR